jgi:hypothetical protein
MNEIAECRDLVIANRNDSDAMIRVDQPCRKWVVLIQAARSSRDGTILVGQEIYLTRLFAWHMSGDGKVLIMATTLRLVKFTARRWIAASLIVAATLAVSLVDSPSALAQGANSLGVRPAVSGRPPTFRDRLVTGLHARLESEVAFVDAVVLAVQSGTLPQRLVDQTYFWARAKRVDPREGRPRRPILFFQPAMAARAKRLGVVL